MKGMRKRDMKKQKYLLLLLAAVMAFALAACDDGTMQDAKEGAFITISFGRDTSRTAVPWDDSVDDGAILHDIFIDESKVGTGVKIGDAVKIYAASPGSHTVSVYGYHPANTLFSYGEAEVIVTPGQNTQISITMGKAPNSTEGTAAHPFHVATEADLRKVGTETKDGGWTLHAHYKQTANITLSGGSFTPIGNTTDRFTGTYDGGEHTITGLSITGTTNSLGLFGHIGAGGTVKNMNVTGTITKSGGDGSLYFGGIAGVNEGTIDNCSFSGTINGGTSNQVGGIVGRNANTLINSRSSATISGGNSVGGIAGVNQGQLERCYNTGAVSGNQSVGGIAGNSNDNGTYIRNCYNTGDISVTTSNTANVGGIVGYNLNSAIVEYCYNTGYVSGTRPAGNVIGSDNVGGIAGIAGSPVQNCVSLGAMVTGDTATTGRIVGSGSGTLSNNTARSDMKIGAKGQEAGVSPSPDNSTNGSSYLMNNAPALTTVFSGWDTALWNISGTLVIGNELPTLKLNTQSPAPTLPGDNPASSAPDGSAGNPFLVATEADLRKVGTETADGGWTLHAHYKQTANIAMSGGFTGIVYTSSKFNGSYDGGGFTITELNITATSSNLGLFGFIGEGGTVKNVNLTGTVTISGTGLVGGIGGIAGANEGTIENCSFSGTVNGSTTSDQVGGIVGRNTGTVINSRSAATISGRTSVGGIAGVNNGNIENSYNTGSVSGNQQVGGIVGNNVNSGNYIKNCYNTGDITATAPTNSHAGGIAGTNQTSALIEHCYNTGNVTGGSTVGGIVGGNTSSGTVQNCIALGARVIGSSDIGRIVGLNSAATLASNSGRADTDGVSGTATATSINGENISINSGAALSIIFKAANGWESSIWNVSGNLAIGGSLPTLKAPNTQSPAPTVPAAYNPLGTADNPFLVATEADLRKVGTETTAGGWTLSAHYKQTADITLSGTFARIGSSTAKFTGTYDGNFYTITGLSMSMANAVLGIFGNIGETGIVKNMTVSGTVTQTGNESTGGIAGVNEGRIENCSFSGTVTGGTTSNEVGGIAGQNKATGTIIYSRNRAAVTGKTSVGGIAGQNNGIIEQSYNTGNITENSQQAGGIAGVNSGTGSAIKNCYNTGAVIGQYFPGGIVGRNQTNALIEYCYNIGTVTGTAGGGGIAGANATGATIRYCGSFGTTVRTQNSASIGRITSGSDGSTLTANKARSDMKVGITGSEYLSTTGVSANDINGENITVGGAIATAFNYFSTSIWNISGMMTVGGAMPTLKDNPQSSPAPTLPAALP